MQKILVVCPAPRDAREISQLPVSSEYEFIFQDYSSEELEKLIYEEGQGDGKSESVLTVIHELIHAFPSGSVAGVISSDDYPADTIHIIEINPRMASQFADLYQKVDGTNSYEILIDIAAGKKPNPKRRQGAFQIAASLVLRTFEDKLVKKVPDSRTLQMIMEQFPETRIEIFVCEGYRLSEELQDGKSYRYALVHLGAATEKELKTNYQTIASILDFRF